MDPTYHAVTIECSVLNRPALRESAFHRARAQGLSVPEAATYLDPGLRSVGDCLVMLLDPGSVLGAGFVVEHSGAEDVPPDRPSLEG